MAAGSVERGWYSLSAAAAYVGLGRDVLREAVNAGDLQAKRKPRTKRQERDATCGQEYAVFSRRALDMWMESQPDVTFGVAQ